MSRSDISCLKGETTEEVTSRDGTPIAYYRSGAGAPLVLVQGNGAASPTAWRAFAALEKRFSVIVVDRGWGNESTAESRVSADVVIGWSEATKTVVGEDKSDQDPIGRKDWGADRAGIRGCCQAGD